MRAISVSIDGHGFRKCAGGYLGISGKGKQTVLVHIRVAELALGKCLPAKAIVHHVDGNRLNNKPSNLVICPDQKYHKLIHMRQDAYEATGNANSRKCKYCKKYDLPESLQIYTAGKRGYNVFHRECHLPALRAAYEKRKQRANHE